MDNQSRVAGRLRDLTAPTGQEDLLSVAYPTPRVRVPLWQAGAVAGVIGILVVAWLGWSSRQTPSTFPEMAAPQAVEATQAGVSQAPGVSGAAGATRAPGATGAPGATRAAGATGAPGESAAAESVAAESLIVVSVVGHVTSPGLVTLAPGARVADALDSATPLPGADMVALNLAQRLEDGQQIHVVAEGESPREPESPASSSTQTGAQAGGALVNINTADAAALDSLPGVGQATAAAIISHREENGDFASVDALQEVPGIGPAKMAKLKPLVTV